MASKILEVLLAIVIGLALVATVATSTSSASTALAPFAGAQALVIIIPLIFVAAILFMAYRKGLGTRGSAALDMTKGHDGIWSFNKEALIPKL